MRPVPETAAAVAAAVHVNERVTPFVSGIVSNVPTTTLPVNDVASSMVIDVAPAETAPSTAAPVPSVRVVPDDGGAAATERSASASDSRLSTEAGGVTREDGKRHSGHGKTELG